MLSSIRAGRFESLFPSGTAAALGGQALAFRLCAPLTSEGPGTASLGAGAAISDGVAFGIAVSARGVAEDASSEWVA